MGGGRTLCVTMCHCVSPIGKHRDSSPLSACGYRAVAFTVCCPEGHAHLNSSHSHWLFFFSACNKIQLLAVVVIGCIICPGEISFNHSEMVLETFLIPEKDVPASFSSTTKKG